MEPDILLVVGILGLVLACFAGVLLFGAPYLPTLTPQVKAALKLADLKPGQTLLELGCGDGKVLIAAAERGIHVVGYELNPLLVAVAWLRTRRYRKLVTVRWANMWHVRWPETDAIFVFLLPKYMKKLDKKIVQQKYASVKLVSFAFKIPERKVASELRGVFLYTY